MEFRFSLCQVVMFILAIGALLSKPSFSSEKTVSTKIESGTRESETTLFQLESIWFDQDGKTVRFKDFRGKKSIVTMAYTHCQYSCPLTVNKLKSIERKILAIGFRDFNIVLVSFDTRRETPSGFQSFMKKMKITDSRWKFLASNDERHVRELSIVLNISYQKDANGEFSHTNNIILLNESGNIVSQLEGLEADEKIIIDRFSGVN